MPLTRDGAEKNDPAFLQVVRHGRPIVGLPPPTGHRSTPVLASTITIAIVEVLIDQIGVMLVQVPKVVGVEMVREHHAQVIGVPAGRDPVAFRPGNKQT